MQLSLCKRKRKKVKGKHSFHYTVTHTITNTTTADEGRYLKKSIPMIVDMTGTLPIHKENRQ